MDQITQVFQNFSWTSIIALVFVIFIVGKIKNIKGTSLRGTPYPALEVEWPNSVTGRILHNGREIMSFPVPEDEQALLQNNQTPRKLLRYYDKGHEVKMSMLLDDPHIFDNNTLTFQVECGENQSTLKPKAELEIAMAYIDNAELVNIVEIAERDVYLQSPGNSSVTFSNFQNRLKPHLRKQKYKDRV